MDYKDDLEKWAEITIERWQQKIQRLHVYETFELMNSFQSHVEMSSNGDVNKIVFTYNYYGLFPELGVGKGVKMGQSSRRTKKPWKTAVFNREMRILAAKVAERFGDEAVRAIKRIELLKK